MHRLPLILAALLPLSTLAATKPWPETFQDRLSWWSLQPVENPPAPKVSDPTWPKSPIDHFVLADLDQQKLTPAPDANPRVLLRRLHFVLTGLPPKPADVDAFVDAHSKNPDAAIASAVDALLASEHFAERFARHWMDWVRYADSHGSEGDPTIPHAWRYRDYLVRALHADVPYDQLVREHIAGDLLTQPRYDPDTGLDESALATAHYRFVHHGFAPTDALDELVRFTDNQIDVVTKAFQAHTVSCARCHDHKFDAISHKDYYALFGTFAATRPATKTIDHPAKLHAHDITLAEQKIKIRHALADAWLAGLPASTPPSSEPTESSSRWHLADPGTFAAWPKHGSAFFTGEPSPPGDFHVPHEGDKIISNIFPGGAVSHALSSKHSAVITSPRFKIPENHVLWVRAAGNDGARLRYVVQNYPRNGTVYPITGLKDDQLKWHRFDLTYWAGDHAHVEIATAADNPVVGDANRQRSWIAITEATVLPKDAPAPKSPESPTDPDSLHAAVTAWKAGTATDLHAATLSRALAENKLPNSLEKLPTLQPLIAGYRKTEALVPVPTRAPGVIDTAGTDWPLYERGDHKKPLAPVARRFLSAIDPTPYQTHQSSGRLQLADSIVDPGNPLTSRVIVNRIWHHIFGTGIVPTTDNFGQLGEKPSNPQLLDHLAHHFTHEQAHSLKKLVRSVVLSRTFRLSSEPSPGNYTAPVRRLEAEAIRDAVLASSGKLDTARSGPPVNGNAPRRSVYLQVRRNNLDQILTTFDAPDPLTTRGRRNVTNVPAQSLALLNNPFIKTHAAAFATSLTGGPADRIHQLFTRAFSRPPTRSETANALAFIDRIENSGGAIRRQIAETSSQLDQLEEARANILAPVRTRLEAERESDKTKKTAPSTPAPLASFEWGSGNHSHQLTARHSARVENGAAVLDGAGHFTSPPFTADLGEKTLEAIVQLDTLDQKGGGVVTVQTNDGNTFDSIVFAELGDRQWLAGSDNHRRTAGLGGASETTATNQPVHLAITYQADGTITAYRNGQPYGSPTRKGNLHRYTANNYHLAVGLRHGPPGSNSGNRMLRGRVLKAALYDRVLAPADIAALASGDTIYVSDNDVRNALTKQQKQDLESLETAIASARQTLTNLEKNNTTPDPWQTLAHSLYNLKEFIYLR